MLQTGCVWILLALLCAKHGLHNSSYSVSFGICWVLVVFIDFLKCQILIILVPVQIVFVFTKREFFFLFWLTFHLEIFSDLQKLHE